MVATAENSKKTKTILRACFHTSARGCSMMTSHCPFDQLFTNNVPHILEKIFLSLDYNSFKACFKVGNTWSKLLKSESLQGRAKSVFHDKITKEEKKLRVASVKGDAETVRKILSYGMVDVNFPDPKEVRMWRSESTGKSTPLCEAALKGHQDVVQLLLAAGADPNMESQYRQKTEELLQTIANGRFG